jgi:DNA-binding MarR family transcriptional regulator
MMSSSKAKIRRPAPPAAGQTADALLQLEGLIGFQLRRSYAVSSRKFVELFADLNIKPGQFSILYAIHCIPDQTQASIARLLSLDPSSIVPLIDQLERKGYVVRTKKDRRSHALSLTPLGATMFERGQERVAAHEQAITAGLSGRERATLLKLLGRLRENGL